MLGTILYLFILLIFYGCDYIILNWNGETIMAYKQICDLFKQKPSILIENSGGGCIWKNILFEPYIKQFCLTDVLSDDRGTDEQSTSVLRSSDKTSVRQNCLM